MRPGNAGNLMEHAFGLYTHIRSNKRRSVALLIGLFFLVYVMVYASALIAEVLTGDAPLDFLLQAALRDFVAALPWATLGTIAWIFIAYHLHQSMIDAITGGYEISRQEEPRLWNILENLCISRGLTMPKLKVMDSEALNAFASGMNPKQYSITVTRGLLERLGGPGIGGGRGPEPPAAAGPARGSRDRGGAGPRAHPYPQWRRAAARHRRGDRRRDRVLRRADRADVLPVRALLASPAPGFRIPRRRCAARDPHRGRAHRRRVAALGRDPVRAVALARVARRCRIGRAHQESRRHDHRLAQDRRPRRPRAGQFRGDGDVHRQSARGFRQSVRHPSAHRKAGRGAGALCGRPRSGADRLAATRRGSRRGSRRWAGARRPLGRGRKAVPAGAAADRTRQRTTPLRPVGHERATGSGRPVGP